MYEVLREKVDANIKYYNWRPGTEFLGGTKKLNHIWLTKIVLHRFSLEIKKLSISLCVVSSWEHLEGKPEEDCTFQNI